MPADSLTTGDQVLVSVPAFLAGAFEDPHTLHLVHNYWSLELLGGGSDGFKVWETFVHASNKVGPWRCDKCDTALDLELQTWKKSVDAKAEIADLRQQLGSPDFHAAFRSSVVMGSAETLPSSGPNTGLAKKD